MLSHFLWLTPAAKDALRSCAQGLKGGVPCSNADLAKALQGNDAADACQGLLKDEELRAAFAEHLKGAKGDVTADGAGKLMDAFQAVLKKRVDAAAIAAKALAGKLKKGSMPSFQEVEKLAGKASTTLKKDWMLWHACGHSQDQKVVPLPDDAVLRERCALAAVAGEGPVAEFVLALHVLQNVDAYVKWEKSCQSSKEQKMDDQVLFPFDKKVCDHVSVRRVLTNALPVQTATAVSDAVAGGAKIAKIVEDMAKKESAASVLPLYIAPPAPKDEKGKAGKAGKEAKEGKGKDKGAEKTQAVGKAEQPAKAAAAATAACGPGSFSGAYHGFASTELRWHLLRYSTRPGTSLSSLTASAPSAATGVGGAGAGGGDVPVEKPKGFAGTWAPCASVPLPPGHTIYSWNHVKAEGMRSDGFVNSWAPSTANPLPPGHTDYSWELALAAGATASAPSAAPAAPAPAKESKGKESKGKEAKGKTEETAPKAKAGKGEAAPKANAADGVAADSAEADLCKIDLRCGCIKEAGLAPGSEKLMMLQVDIGEEKPRQVLSGIAKFYKADQLMNRKVIAYCNIKPNKMAGLDSQAMILCATEGKGTDGEKVQLLIPPTSTKEGTQLTCGSLKVGSMAGEVNVKKISKVWERVQPLLTTNSSKQATFQGTLLQLDAKPITVDSIADGPIS